MNIRIGIYLLLIVVGLVVLAWPEHNDRMMIQFSETHGPSALDVVGIVILFSRIYSLNYSSIHKVLDDSSSSRQNFFAAAGSCRRYLFVADRRCLNEWQ